MEKAEVIVILNDKRKFRAHIALGHVRCGWRESRTATVTEAIETLPVKGGLWVGKHFVSWHSIFAVAPAEAYESKRDKDSRRSG